MDAAWERHAMCESALTQLSHRSTTKNRTRTGPAEDPDVPQYNESNLILLERHEHVQKSLRILSFASYIITRHHVGT